MTDKAQPTRLSCGGVRATFAAAVLAAFAVTAAGCAQSPTGTAASKPPTPTLPASLTGEVSWRTCPNSYWHKNADAAFKRNQADCGAIQVPAVYSGRQGADLPAFSIAMMRLRASGKTKRGTLFINPGGPGQSGIDQLQTSNFPAKLRQAYDIVGFDPRGVARSQPVSGNPIRCTDELDFATYWNGEDSPSNQSEADLNKKLSDDYANDCIANNPAWWTLGTADVARDLEQMRTRVAGDAKLNFLGSSYGTTIASYYLRLFPKTSGHIVLDSVTDNSPDEDTSALTRAKSLEAQVLRLVDGYAKAKGMTRAQVQALLMQVRGWGDDNQLRGFAGLKPFPGSSTARLSSEYMFTHGIHVLTYYDSETALQYFTEGLDAVRKSKWNGLFEYLALNMDGYDLESMYKAYQNEAGYNPTGYTRDNSYEIMTMVNGIDRDQRELKTHAEQDAFDVKYAKAAPFWHKLTTDPSGFKYYDDEPGNMWSWEAFKNDAIPDPPKNAAPRTNTSGKPVLIVGSLKESVTPYAFAVSTAKQLKSPLVTWTGTEHAPLAGFAHSCLNQVFLDYMLKDSLPSEGKTCSK